MHFYSTLVRGLGKAAPSANFQEVLENLWWRLDRKLSLDDVEVSARVILLDAIRKGTTTLVDHHASPGAVRGSLGPDREGRQGFGPALLPLLRGLRPRRRGRDRGGARGERRVRPRRARRRTTRSCGRSSACTRPSPSPTRRSDGPSRMGHDLGVGFHVHVAEAASDVAANRSELRRSARSARLVAHGILGEGSIAAHAVHCDDADKDAPRRERRLGRPQPAVEPQQRRRHRRRRSASSAAASPSASAPTP